MADEYGLTNEDEKNGLKDFLYGARDTAADAVGNLFSELGIDNKQFEYIYKMPMGLEEGSDIPGAYDPGIYGIIVGRESENVEDFLDDDGTEQTKIQNRLAATVTHELVHSFQTVPSPFLEDSFDTVGNTVMGWTGLEEGMAEALGNIAVKKQLKNWGLEETAKNLEDVCAERDMPATQMSARLIRKMKPEQLSWYLTCGQTGEAKSNNKIKKAFGPSYEAFCQNMINLHDYECEINHLSDDTKKKLVEQTTKFIDNAMTQE